MRLPDWIVLIVTLVLIILYGMYKSRSTKDLDGYFLSNRSMPWSWPGRAAARPGSSPPAWPG